MTHDEMIEVIQAHKDGKVIQFMAKGGGVVEFNDRRRTDNHMDFINIDYRIKPEPKEYWLVPYIGGIGFEVFENKPDKAYVDLNAHLYADLDFSCIIHVVAVDDQERNQ